MLSIKDLARICFLALLWAPSFLFIKIGVETLDPFTFTFFRCLFSFVATYIILKCSKLSLLPVLGKWKKILVSALLLNALPFFCCAYGEQYIDSSTAGIIEGSVPLFTLLLGYLFFKKRDNSYRELVCILIGFIGLIITFIPTLYSTRIDSIIGFLAIILMSVFFAGGFLYAESKPVDAPPMALVTLQMFFSMVLILPFSLTLGAPSWNHLTREGLLAALCLGAGCTAIGWSYYFHISKKVSAKHISISTLLFPIFAMILGKIFLREMIDIYQATGTILILGGIFFMSELPSQIRMFLKARQSDLQ